MMTSEYRRMGLCPSMGGTKAWRISQCNDKYEVCSTYPKLLLVPGTVSDEELATAAKFRMSGRLAVVSWRHQTNGCVLVRSSQPLVGVFGWRNPTDEKLLLAFSYSCSLSNPPSTEKVFHNGGTTCQANGVRGNSSASLSKEDSDEFFTDSEEEGLSRFDSDDELAGLPTLKVFDLRSYTAALGNRAKGGGCECTDYYGNCEIFYKGLPNIHTVRKSFHQMRSALNSDDPTNFLSSLEGTQWLSYICQLLSVAAEVVGVVNDDHTPCPVLVHCSDGWDRTTQIITLAELMLDPYYRTIKGFRVLVEREWVGFGHRFSDRCGHVTDDANSRSPIFLQWLDCVHQLLQQCPCDFQFNETFLVKLGQHCFSCLYGTFLCNSMKEREDARVSEDTYPVWSLLHEGNTEIINYLYMSSKRVICPKTNIKYMMLWREMYVNPLLTPYHTGRESVVSQTQPRPIERPNVSHSPSFGTPDSKAAPTSLDSNYQGTPNSQTLSEDIKLSSEVEVKTNSLELERMGSPKLDQETETLDPESKDECMESRPKSGPVEPGSKPTENCTAGHEPESLPTHDDCDQVSSSPQLNGELSSDELAHQQCGESHESLHGTHLEAIKNKVPTSVTPIEGVAIGNGHTHVSLVSKETGNDIPTTEEDRHTPIQTRLKALPVQKESSTQSSSTPPSSFTKNGISHSTTPNKPCNGELLREAIDDLSPHMALFQDPPERTAAGVRVRLGLDGLPSLVSVTQKRVRELVVEPQREIQRLRGQLREMQLALQRHGVGDVRLVEGEGCDVTTIEDQVASALDDQSPTSLGSWDCVDRDEGGGVRWVPDHAVSHCQRCGVEFWAGLRKHHCRSCGGVFCGSCSNFYCPVPHEQLFEETRVCEKCFYKLDGHLRVKKPPPVNPT